MHLRPSRSLALGFISGCLVLRCSADEGGQSSSAGGDPGDHVGDETAADDAQNDDSAELSATSDEGGEHNSGDSNEDPCALPEHIDGIQLESFARLTHAGQRLVSAGSQLASCGHGFISLHNADGRGDQIEFEPAAACRGLSFDGESRLLVASESALYLIQTEPKLSVLDRVELPNRRGRPSREGPLSQLGPYGVLAAGAQGYLAMGAGGLFQLSLADEQIDIVGEMPAALEPRGLALSEAGLLVAEGTAGLRLLDLDDGRELDHLALDFGFAHALDVREADDGPTLVALARMGWGVQLLKVEDHSFGLLANKVPHGATTRALLHGDGLLTSNLSKLVRYRIGADGQILTPTAFQARRDRGQLTGPWFSDLVRHRPNGDRTEPELYALEGDAIYRVILPDLDEDDLAPQIRIDDASFSLWPEDRNDDTDGLVLLHNAGPGELILTGLETDDPFQVAFDPELEPRPGCPDQRVVPPGHGFLVQVDIDPNHDGHAVNELRIASSDPDDPIYRVTLEYDRPGLEPGDPAPAFNLITGDGAHLRLADHIGKVFFLKPLTFS